MRMTLRWYGPADPVSLQHVRQIPGVEGIVSSLHDVPVGDSWTRDGLDRLRDTVESADLQLEAIESLPVHEDIKLGRPSRDHLIDAYAQSLGVIGAAGVSVVCYNFMPVFDWTRTDLALQLSDGSTALAYDHGAMKRVDLSRGTRGLPGWGSAYTATELDALRAAYSEVEPRRLWDHLAYFLERVVPAAETAGVALAIHPDDPPWPVFGLPRIVTSAEALNRVTRIVDRPANGVTLCTGSLGASGNEDLPALATHLCRRGRLHFIHLRSVARTGREQFHESPHRGGDVDLPAVAQALAQEGFTGPARPDHGRMIWGEEGRPGYGLYDRALGATYLLGLWDSARRCPSTSPSYPLA